MDYIKQAYSTDTSDGRINVLYSMLLRKRGKVDKANALIDEILAYDPLDFSALYEKSLLQGNASLVQWHKNMQAVDNDYLEVATHYMNAGLLQDGISLLSDIENPESPLIYYYLSWFYANKGDNAKAAEMQKLAKDEPLEYVFPYREETEKVLNNSIEIDPQDATAYYSLGNLLYDRRPKDAMEARQKAGAIDSSIPMVWRNLAFGAFYHQKNPSGAIEYMTKSISLDNSYPLWYDELSQYYDASDADFKDNLALLRNNLGVVKKDVSAPKTYVELLNLNGEYDEAIQILNNHHFRTGEGGRGIYWRYVDAHTKSP